MREVCYWEADDGTEFENERDCFNYEFNQKIKDMIGKDLRIFDDKYKEITNCTYESVYNAFGFQVLTIEGAKFLVKWSDGYEMPFKSWDIKDKGEGLLGIWVYEALGYGGWLHLDEFKREVDGLYALLQQ